MYTAGLKKGCQEQITSLKDGIENFSQALVVVILPCGRLLKYSCLMVLGPTPNPQQGKWISLVKDFIHRPVLSFPSGTALNLQF